MRNAIISASIFLALSCSAGAVPVTCSFSDQEQAIVRQAIEVVTGSTKAPAGGIENAQVGVYLTNKFRGQLPALPDNCAVPQPPAPQPPVPLPPTKQPEDQP